MPTKLCANTPRLTDVGVAWCDTPLVLVMALLVPPAVLPPEPLLLLVAPGQSITCT